MHTAWTRALAWSESCCADFFRHLLSFTEFRDWYGGGATMELISQQVTTVVAARRRSSVTKDEVAQFVASVLEDKENTPTTPLTLEIADKAEVLNEEDEWVMVERAGPPTASRGVVGGGGSLPLLCTRQLRAILTPHPPPPP